MMEPLADFLEPIARKGEIDLGGLNFKSLRKRIKEITPVCAADPSTLIIDGEKKNAINYCKSNKIKFDCDVLDSIQQGSRRAALIFHEYLACAGVDDTDYKYSKNLYSNPSVKFFLDNLEFTEAPSSGQELPFQIECKLYDHGRIIPNALGRVGPPTRTYNMHTYFSGRFIRNTPKGRLHATVDTGVDPVTQYQGTFNPKVKRPAIRVTIGYNATFSGPPQIVLTENDLRVTGDFDAVVSNSEEQIIVHCKRVYESRPNVFPEILGGGCGSDATKPLPSSQEQEIIEIIEHLR